MFSTVILLLLIRSTSDSITPTLVSPSAFRYSGAAKEAFTGYRDEIAGAGAVLDSARPAGTVSAIVPLERSKGRWVTFEFRGKAEDGFVVSRDQLYMEIGFCSKQGSSYQDSVRRLIYREVLNDRKAFATNGDFGKGGGAAWRTYQLEELLPFSETDTVKLTVGFANGSGVAKPFTRFVVSDFTLTQRPLSITGKVDPAAAKVEQNQVVPALDALTPLGGRWYYRPAPGETITDRKVVITEANADRLFYNGGTLTNPFAGNMSAMLREGYMDAQGNLVTKDRLIHENVRLTFDGSTSFQVTTHNLPNHPTGKFPDTFGTQGYNPSYIMEVVRTYRLPLDPKKSPNAFAMTPNNSNLALNMGPIGFAVNGVVFFNPFDAQMTDASSLMDRCCGHPGPDYAYHYHKYPICVNTSFVDKGEGHSPVIGFAFDGFPVYGPYEAPDELARDSKSNPLDAFNAHYDSIRGWHYHVTPGKFPYLIGGYMGAVSRGRRG